MPAIEQKLQIGSTNKDTAEWGSADPAALKNYEKVVEYGCYKRDGGGLQGKYDNVRRYWEDRITRYALHDFVGPLVLRKQRALAHIRVLDLGCGSGEGYEILTSLKKESQDLISKKSDLLPSEMIGFYKGIDISPAMVAQGKKTYENHPKIDFVLGDLSQGLAGVNDDPPYDIYFSSYGALSHLNDEAMAQLIEEIYDHSAQRCIFVADLIGRYSVEWPCYWEPPTDKTNMRPYSMSYLYAREMQIEIPRFPIRYWGAEEFDQLLSKVIESRGGHLVKKQLWDRSILVGRHMNTGEYNPHAQPIRRAVSSLHEFNRRTDLKGLIFDYELHPQFPAINAFFETFQLAWNTVVYAAIEALEHWNDADWLAQPPGDAYPPPVQEALVTIRNCIRHLHWFRMGDSRANLFEPQLGYILRHLEMKLQQGLGAGHALLAIYEISKEGRIA